MDNETYFKEPLRVGFGPVTDSNSYHQSGVKVAEVMDLDPRFRCGFFSWNPFRLEEMAEYDVLIFIKYVPAADIVGKLKALGKVMVLDYHDAFLCPSVYESDMLRRYLKAVYYFREERKILQALKMVDACFYANPLLADVVQRAGMRPLFLHRQIFNGGNECNYKTPRDGGEKIVLYWTGVGLNHVQNIEILPVIYSLRERYGCRVVYDTDTVGELDWVEYRRFNPDTWEDDMLDADIAFRWRDTSNMQRFKDANKVLSYMAAGLPAVVYPTESEKLVMRHGETGFFADSPEEFEQVMIKLICDPELRSRIGTAAHKDVWSKYSLRAHVEVLKGHILELVRERASGGRT